MVRSRWLTVLVVAAVVLLVAVVAIRWTRQREPSPPPTPTPAVTMTATPALGLAPGAVFTPASVPPEYWHQPSAARGLSDEVLGASAEQVAVADDGQVWTRLAAPDGGPDRLLTEASDGLPREYRSLEEAVTEQYDDIVADGSLADIWAADPEDHVWVGPKYFDGREWRAAGEDTEEVAGELIYEERAVVAADDRAWVPYRSDADCAVPEGCEGAGLHALSPATGVMEDLAFEPMPEAGAYGVPEVRLFPDIGAESAIPGEAEDGSRGLGDGPQPAAVTRSALYLLPDKTPIAYPHLGGEPDPDAESPARNAGYATAATRLPDGRLQVFTWVERHLGREIAHNVYAHTWTGDAWADETDLTDSPLFQDGVEFERIVAATYAPDGTLWVASSSGAVAARRDGKWVYYLTPDANPLPDDQPIADLAADDGGQLWFATTAGPLALDAERALEAESQ